MELLANALVRGILVGSAYALIAVGFVLIYKATQVLNFAQGYMTMVGGFICYTFTIQLGLPLPLGIAISLAVGYGMGVLIERGIMHHLIGQPLLSLVVVTLFIGTLLDAIRLIVWGGLNKNLSFMPLSMTEIGPLMISNSLLICFVVVLFCISILLVLFKKTKLGLAMRAVSEDQQLSLIFGVKVKSIYTIVWGISGVLAVAGATALGGIAPIGTPLLGFGMIALVVVLLGGLESFVGAIVGGLIVGVVYELTASYIDPLIIGASGVAPYIVLLIILIIKPSGLFGLKKIERI